MAKVPAQREIKQERAARTRVEILEAAITLFARRGFLATTMADLSRAIRMTPGALYWHFPTKEDLLLAAIEELHQRCLRAFEGPLREARAQSARAQLQVFTERIHEFLRAHREYGIFFAMLAAEAADSNDRVADAIREKLSLYAKVLEGLIRYGQKTGELREDLDAMHASHSLFGGFLGVLVHHNLFRATMDYDPLVTALQSLVTAGAWRTPSGG
ncbi:TetR/AcrR family transcriptional regulator [Pyxidicoccus fallax]|uniref:TetR/AcrR family transcriptional regulator n=1 Tax=Pyxidicoccus fallax TaxID=394095 RepID=A0A848LWH5_9BACT|nr:TetR/AcrR family transcriptional regulator [Pyxidicoccus fallax]NMO21999.1 TetR/AcrR family transcriptional regulator [Pyxidicoccus fallax]NPC83455.1 TetR/AcrR family transcriptional regulator [Pyxidicoccus fallax]